MAKGKMATSRSYWVHWTCVFQQIPDEKILAEKRKLMTKYLQNYLKELVSSKLNGMAKAGPYETTIWDDSKMKWVTAGGNENMNSQKNSKKQKASVNYSKPWGKWLQEEWNYFHQENGAIFSYVAYFKNDKEIRISNAIDSGGKGTMNPPPPPPPPGDL